MKKINSIALLMFVLLFMGCKKDDTDPTAITLESLGGSWKITEASGTEWEKTKGIITPKAADPGSVGAIVIIGFNPNSFQYLNPTLKGQGTIALVGDQITVTAGTDVLEFTLKNKTATGMLWEQRAPNKDSDYSFNSGGNNYLYYQKFWTMTKN